VHPPYVAGEIENKLVVDRRVDHVRRGRQEERVSVGAAVPRPGNGASMRCEQLQELQLSIMLFQFGLLRIAQSGLD
jgi:hypothetical protein